MINKGFISSITDYGRMAIVIPQEASENVTFPLVIPFFLLECLEPNMPVVYSTFPDNTGIILARLDGEWNHKIYRELTVEGTTHMTEMLTVDSGIIGTGTGSEKGLVMSGSIRLDGNFDATGTISSDSSISSKGILLENHVHSGVQAGVNDTGQPR